MKKILLTTVITFLGTFLYGEVNEIDNLVFSDMIESNIPVIDIRRQEEWLKTGVVKDSFLITFFDKDGKADVRAWLSKVNQIVKRDEPLILICRTGRRTGIVAKFLTEKLGYSRVYNVTDGRTSWIKQGQPVIKPSL